MQLLCGLSTTSAPRPPQGLLAGLLGVDNLNVVRSIAGLLAHGSFSALLHLVKDGDPIALVQHLILARGPESVRITIVKGPCHGG